MIGNLKHNRRSALVVAALLASLSIANQATAQIAWKPERPVTLVVPYAAGGGTDATARAVSRRLGELWGQPVVVENLSGADGLIGTRKVVGAKPDGYTLLLQVPAITVTKYLPALKGVDPLSQLDPITAISTSPAAIVASAKLPVKTLGELFDYCKSADPPCSFATGESLARMRGKSLAAEGGMPGLIIVNYRGTGAIVTDMIANNVNFSFTGLTAALPHHKAGTLRILATQGKTRPAILPDVPTTTEAGYPEYRSVTWYGLFAPRDTPDPVKSGIVAALREAVQDTDVKKTIDAAGAEPLVNSPTEFTEMIREDSEELAALAKKYPFE